MIRRSCPKGVGSTACTTAAAKRYRYDGFGRMIEKRSAARGVQYFAYDAEHRLIEVRSQKDGRETVVTMTYDPLGRRIAKTEHDSNGYPLGETRFDWEGLRLLQEHRHSQTSLYIYEEDSYAPLARVDGTGEHQSVRYYHNDLNGLPEQLTEADGHSVWQATYRVWGNTLEEVREPYYIEEQNLRFQGQYLDRETGLHFNTFRFYDPDVGRFTTPDPIGLDGEFNLYQYAPNPIAWIDPWGWKTCGAANGNSRQNNKVNHVYVIRNKTTGQVYKYGISGGKVSKKGKSYRAESQVRRLNRGPGTDKYESAIIRKNVTRSKALKVEQGRVNGYSVAAQRAGQAPTFPKVGINPVGNSLPNATR